MSLAPARPLTSCGTTVTRVLTDSGPCYRS